jgi:hypothetical protein
MSVGFPIEIKCVIVDDPCGGFTATVILSGIDTRDNATVVSHWVRSCLMGNLELLGQMFHGQVIRDPNLGPQKSVS